MKSVLALCVCLAWLVAGVESQAATETWPQTQGREDGSQLWKMFHFQQSFISMQNALLNLQQFVKSVDYHGLIKEVQLLRSDLNETKTKQESAEHELENTKAKLDNTETELRKTKTKLDNTEMELKKTKTEFETNVASIEFGSTFIRWGRKTCTSKSELVYSGAVGGSHYTHIGAAANALCLTMTPDLEVFTPKPAYSTFLYGAEYEYFPGRHDQDVPCAVCHTPMTTTIMVPATRSCPAGWTVQYIGYLSAGHHYHKAATEFLCLDGQLEGMNNGGENKDGRLFYIVYTSCGSLHCPPYVNNKAITCVVCSK